MVKKNRALLAVLGPMGLGIATALIFLAVYLGKNKSIVTIKNETGLDLMGGQLRITSLPKEQEVGEIKSNDSAKVQFEKFGDGRYVFSGQFKGGKTMLDSGGYVTSGASYKDVILLKTRNDSLVADFRQKFYK